VSGGGTGPLKLQQPAIALIADGANSCSIFLGER